MNYVNHILKNIKYSLLNYIVVNGFKFLTRIVFIKTLPIEYLGITGLFSNIFVMLSLAELGVGPAMVYALYKPLAYDDKETVNSIMLLFKKLYLTIGVIILILGLLLYPFLDLLIKENTQIEYLNYYYLIFLFNTAVSYLWSYKRSLLIADQKQYIVNNYQAIVQMTVSILQIIGLYLEFGYFSYIILVCAGTIIENFFISRKANIDYSFFYVKGNKIDKHIKNELVNNIKALIGHKIGMVVSFSIGSIIISKYVGLTATGIYSNYFMVLNIITVFVNKIFEAITASIGNLIIINSREEQIKAFKITEFITAFQASIIFTGLYTLLNPFITLWIGKQYLFDDTVVLALAFNFYLLYMRKCVLTFRDAAGLYWQDRYKPVAEAFVNLTVSIYCTIRYGVIGVALGGIAGSLLVGLWVEAYILFKNSINIKLKAYFKDLFEYLVTTFFAAFVSKLIYKMLVIEATIFNFVVWTILVLIITYVVWRIKFYSNNEMKFINSKIRKIYRW